MNEECVEKKKKTSTECINHVVNKWWSSGNIKINTQWAHMTECRNKQIVLVVKHMQVSIYAQSNEWGSKTAAVEKGWVKSWHQTEHYKRK